MNLLTLLFDKKKSEEPKAIADYQREALVRQGKEQFQKMIKLGLGAPIKLA